MMLLRDVRDYISALDIAEDECCYCGKMADKKKKAIGVYPLKNGRSARKTIGGDKNRSFETKGISFLIHWNESPSETEIAAGKLQAALNECRDAIINGHLILFIEISYDEPIPVGTDENGIYEYVIECLFYVKKESE